MNEKKIETICLAGGCFWGVEELFSTLSGVQKTEVGYTGGDTKNPTYKEVCLGNTGHAEAIRIEFDPDTISLSELLHFFFRIHDPTTLNRQGNDRGSQYRSAIFVRTSEQQKTAEKVIAQVEESGRWKNPIVTTIEPDSPFYSAEEYHQKYLKKNPGGYSCHYIRE